MLVEVFTIILLLVIYFFFYVEIKINKNNDVNMLDEELTKKSLANEVMFKLPFYFDASHLNPKFKKDKLVLIEKDKINKNKKMKSDREPPQLFKPILRHTTKSDLFLLKKNGQIPLYKNNGSVNHIFVRNGRAKIALIHPKYKDNFDENNSSTSKEYLWNNASFKYLECNEGTVVCVPNYWFTAICNDSDNETIIEVFSFTTIVRSVLLFVNKQFNYSKTLY